MLDKLFGSQKAALILLYIYHYGEGHVRGIARDLDVSVSAVQNQIKRFEDAGVIVCKQMGRTNNYFYNRKNPITKPLLEMLNIVHSSISLKEKKELFSTRHRPRRPGKPIIGKIDED